MADIKAALHVTGVPVGQGSKQGFVGRDGKVHMREGASAAAHARLMDWRRAITDAARTWLTGDGAAYGPFSGPVSVYAGFAFPPTKSDPYRHWHTVRPDADHLARALGDALVASGLLGDDSQITEWTITKRYAWTGSAPGCEVVVRSLADSETANRQRRKASARLQRRASEGRSR